MADTKRKQKLLIVGAGGHAVSCIDVVEQQGVYDILGLVGLPEEVGKKVLGYEVLGTDQDLPYLNQYAEAALIAVGQIKTIAPRREIAIQLLELGFTVPVVVSPHAYVSEHAQLGAGTIVMHGAIINANVRIGNFAIINSKALLEHDVQVGEFCHVSTMASINGSCRVGDNCFIGSQACIQDGLIIGSNSVIASNSLLRKNLSEGSSFVGHNNSKND
ncbi:acetyltransferase [Planctobacterium marinum]|uniref:Acetyltransferase n=1 Tax=Planctobacterium marinum TaxID=1631968 RepID=A0AA48HS74_9ALTE|nr:acetyltransferase [Planctobacterium marinum]